MENKGIAVMQKEIKRSLDILESIIKGQWDISMGIEYLNYMDKYQSLDLLGMMTQEEPSIEAECYQIELDEKEMEEVMRYPFLLQLFATYYKTGVSTFSVSAWEDLSYMFHTSVAMEDSTAVKDLAITYPKRMIELSCGFIRSYGMRKVEDIKTSSHRGREVVLRKIYLSLLYWLVYSAPFFVGCFFYREKRTIEKLTDPTYIQHLVALEEETRERYSKKHPEADKSYLNTSLEIGFMLIDILTLIRDQYDYHLLEMYYHYLHPFKLLEDIAIHSSYLTRVEYTLLDRPLTEWMEREKTSFSKLEGYERMVREVNAILENYKEMKWTVS